MNNMNMMQIIDVSEKQEVQVTLIRLPSLGF